MLNRIIFLYLHHEEPNKRVGCFFKVIIFRLSSLISIWEQHSLFGYSAEKLLQYALHIASSDGFVVFMAVVVTVSVGRSCVVISAVFVVAVVVVEVVVVEVVVVEVVVVEVEVVVAGVVVIRSEQYPLGKIFLNVFGQ